MKRIPIIPTIIVGLAVAVMIALGFWQLQRKGEKEAMIARYSAASGLEGEVPYPRARDEVEQALYRNSRIVCAKVLSTRSTASRNLEDVSGLAQVARCALKRGGETDIYLGWTQRPQPVDWKGGEVAGFIAPGAEPDGARLIATPPTFGLRQLARPDPASTPNNHLAYAGQWFFFALTALVIYVLALRKQMGGRKED